MCCTQHPSFAPVRTQLQCGGCGKPMSVARWQAAGGWEASRRVGGPRLVQLTVALVALPVACCSAACYARYTAPLPTASPPTGTGQPT